MSARATSSHLILTLLALRHGVCVREAVIAGHGIRVEQSPRQISVVHVLQMHASYIKAVQKTKQVLSDKVQVDSDVAELRTKAKEHSKCVCAHV
jgi:hypothetical protein